MSKIPRTPKRFANWLAPQKGAMPARLLELADRARRAIDTLTAHKNSVDLPVIRLRFMPAVLAFEEAHAAWEKSR